MIFVCLGNKGEKYKQTRHNAGRMFGKYLTKKLQCSNVRKFKKGKIWELDNGWRVAFLDCFMNNSGPCLKNLLNFTNRESLITNHLCVVHDDLDIPLGEFKIQQDRGSAGHRGVESVINALATSNFKRIRIGIGRSDKIPEEKYVLMHFTKKEKEELKAVFEKILRKVR